MFCLLLNRARHTLNAIGHCIVWFVFDMQISLRLKIWLYCDRRVNTIIFQTPWHFASASRLKFSHDDFYTDIDWIFKINEINLSNRKPTNTMTNRIQPSFDEYFLQILQITWIVEIAPKTRGIINIDILFYWNNTYDYTFRFLSVFFLHCLLNLDVCFVY